MKKCINIIILFLLLIIFSDNDALSKDQEDYPKILASAKPLEATIGTPVEYKVVIAGRDLKQIRIQLPEKKEYFPENGADEKKNEKKEEDPDDPSRLIPLYIIHDARKQDSSDQDVTYISVLLDLSYYRPGKHKLPELKIFDKENIRIGYQIPEVTVKGINDKGELEEIEPPLELSGNYYRLILVILISIAASFALYFLIRYIKKKKEERAASIPPVPPIDIFMKEINKLREQKFIENGKYEDFILELSNIFRRFLSAQFKFDAMEMTETEIMNNLERMLTKIKFEKYQEDARKILYLWDITKFAEYTPTEDLLTGNLDSTVSLAKKLASDMRSSLEDEHNRI